MDTTKQGIAKLLQQNCRAHRRHEGEIDGKGFHIDRVQPGTGFSVTEHASKLIGNGHYVYRRTVFLRALDKLTGFSDRSVETFTVWVGWERSNLDLDQLFDGPPLALPAGATGWTEVAFDGPAIWDRSNLEAEQLLTPPPPLDLPAGAPRCSDAPFEGPHHWYAVFEDGELAERFARSLPATLADAEIPPLVRGLA